MTVDDPIHSPGSFLIDDVPPIFYDAPIPYKHWQLRSLICSPSPNTLYYPNDSKIYSLNTETREQKLVTNLHFEPRCIGAKYGWVCAGGVENGQFAAIRVAEGETTTPLSSQSRKSSAEHVDDPSLLDLPMYLDETLDKEQHDGRTTGKLAKYVRLTELGGSIVNSITLHKPKDAKNDDNIVAVVTNNDKTVRIFSLSRFQLLTTLHLPCHTNHASISPDGQHLVVVGDSPKVFFYRPSPLYTRRETKTMYTGWTLSSHLPLTTGSEALISTHFSPTSALCAVASQDGSVTVFDMERLIQQDTWSLSGTSSPIIEVIPSSRPRSQVGAVRSVQFSPSPWDLLVWAEHTGRVSIADIRTGFCRRQIINVVANGDNITERPVIQSPEEEDHADFDISSNTHNFDRYFGMPAPNDSDVDMLPSVSDDEEAYIQSMRSFLESRRHLDTLIHGTSSLTQPSTGQSVGGRGVEVNNVDIGDHEWHEPAATNLQRRASMSNASAFIRPVATLPPPPPTLDQTESSRAMASMRNFQQAMQALEDRRSAMNERQQNTQQGGTASERTGEMSVPTSAQVIARNPGQPFSQINTDTSSANSTPRIQHDRDTSELRIHRARERLARLEYIRRGHLTERSIGAIWAPGQDSRRRRNSSDELDITGCTLSCDGRKLYVATTAGIFEYAIDLTSRRVFPRIQPR